MTRSDEVLSLAQGWLGTPYLHQASRKGAGCDCLGLLRGIWRDIYGVEPRAIPAYTADWSEPDGREELYDAARQFLVPLALTDARPGDVLLFRMRPGAVAKHLGILARTGEAAAFIHAYSGHGVVLSPLSAPWRRKIAATFRFP